MSDSVKCSVCTHYEPKDENEIASLVICPHGNLAIARAVPKGEARFIAIEARQEKITVSVGTAIAEADAVVVIALKVLDPKQQRIGATYEAMLTDGFVDQVVPAAFLETLTKVLGMVEADLTRRLRTGTS